MTVSEIRSAYLSFFKERGHIVIPSASLVPMNDPTTLFTSSGMQPLLPYFLGAVHPSGSKLVNSQRSFRGEDIEEVGDNRHTTFFEMLGNWSLGDYFKKEQLQWFFEFLTGVVGLDPKRLYVSVFSGNPSLQIPQDDESVQIWKELFASKGIDAKDYVLGSEAQAGERGMKDGRIFYYDAKKNWWSRSGPPGSMPSGEPGGPDSEVFFDFGTKHDRRFGDECHPNCDCGRFMEIGNSVFMEYLKNEDGTFSKLPKRNVDFGGGLERITAASTGDPDVYHIDVFDDMRRSLESLSKTQYDNPKTIQSFRIVMEHTRAAIFLIADGVRPGNVEQGYFVRRLIRRAVYHSDRLGVPEGALSDFVEPIVSLYSDPYVKPSISSADIALVIREEDQRFRKTLTSGMKEFEKVAGSTISGKDAFTLLSTHGFPAELTAELAKERGVQVDTEGLKTEITKHQDISRAGAEGKFKGGLADTSEKTTMLHTTTHLMLQGLRKYLGDHVHQAGSNITSERTRFDFTHPEKVPREILDQVENYVNEAITKKCMVTIEPMRKEAAKAAGVEGSFWEKYPDIVNVYVVKAEDGTIYSRELCGGPHVQNTGTISGTFKIVKEEAVSQGVRRIKGVLA